MFNNILKVYESLIKNVLQDDIHYIVGLAEVGSVGCGRIAALVVRTAWCPLEDWTLVD